MNRTELCQSTSRKLAEAASSLPKLRAVVGFDGFVDEIIDVVDKRHDLARHDSIRTISALAERISRAARQSSNYELVVRRMKLGGNGPIMANALSSLGMSVTYIGNLGYPKIHPVFEELAQRAEVLSIAEPAHTDALEFDDGKLMFGKLTPLAEVNWDNLISRIRQDKLASLFAEARVIGMVNWTMLPHMSAIWLKLLEEILPTLPKRDRTLFVDLADPEKRTPRDLVDALTILSRFAEKLDVILGLNLSESMQVAKAMGLPELAEPERAIAQTAAQIRAKLKLGCVVIHPRGGAAAARGAEAASVVGPFVQQPTISTGAGDHFNAGFALAQTLGFTLEESLCAGVATSGYYVRAGVSPTAQQLAEFVAMLPPPEE